ncbi:MAG: TadE/TadG family type IV pilus assembly protein [Pseudomonadota bacterium]
MRVLASNFLKSIRGNVALTAGLMAPIFLGVAGVGVDYSIIYQKTSKLQEVADSSALAAVRELSIVGTDENQIFQVVKAFTASSGISQKRGEELVVDTQTDFETNEVTVSLEYYWSPLFAHFIDAEALPIKVSTTAKIAGEGLTCVLGLMQPIGKALSSLHFDNRSVLEASGCSVFSNSKAWASIRADRRARINALTICSAGGVLRRGAPKFNPQPITDCPPVEDPLIDRVAPAVGNCTEKDLIVTTKQLLEPGVYCGGLRIEGNAEVKLRRGIYTIKDGPLIVTDTASLHADEASFHLTGQDSVFEFHENTSISLAAMQDGALAGLLVFEERSVPYSFGFNPNSLIDDPEYEHPNMRLHKISSNDARTLLGTIYVPRSILLVNANAPVADASAYTAIIAGRFWLREGPTLYLNADYTDTLVPVPTGLVNAEPRIVR